MGGGLRRLGKLHLNFSWRTAANGEQDCCGAEVEAACANPASGSVILLEARFVSDRFLYRATENFMPNSVMSVPFNWSFFGV